MIAVHQGHQCVPPQEIRKINRQAKNRKRERDPARKAAVKEFCKGKLCTCGCGQPANCVHHPNDTQYGDDWGELSECEPWRSYCHHKYHKGYVRCPKCGGWMRAGNELCYTCNHTGNPATNPPHRRANPAKRIKHKHPCRSHLRSGRCQKSHTYQQCTFAARDALRECEKAKPRGGVPA